MWSSCISGHYSFTVTVRSDSYLGLDVHEDIKLEVCEAKEAVTEHPQVLISNWLSLLAITCFYLRIECFENWLEFCSKIYIFWRDFCRNFYWNCTNWEKIVTGVQILEFLQTFTCVFFLISLEGFFFRNFQKNPSSWWDLELHTILFQWEFEDDEEESDGKSSDSEDDEFATDDDYDEDED